jgi:hypothetical protein
MDDKELRTLYGRMVESFRFDPVESELGAWKTVLGHFRASDLDAACRRWKADTDIEERTGKPRGGRLPSPAELKLSIERFNQSHRPNYQGNDRPSKEATEREQSTPEWEEANKKLRAQIARLAGVGAFPGKRA